MLLNHLEITLPQPRGTGLVGTFSRAGPDGVSAGSSSESTMSDSVRLKRMDQHLFDQIATRALNRERLRQNHNFHQQNDLVQRFLNVLQPGTYVRPHRHVRDQAGSGLVVGSAGSDRSAALRC